MNGVSPASTVHPFRTAVPFWGQTSQSSSSLSPRQDCGSKGAKWPKAAEAELRPLS